MTFAVITGMPALMVLLTIGAVLLCGLIWQADRFGGKR